jgi:hypothetical protein
VKLFRDVAEKDFRVNVAASTTIAEEFVQYVVIKAPV